MWIPGFNSYIENSITQTFVLENCSVVFDAKTFFYGQYTRSELTRLTGGEYDKYASYLREFFQHFQSNNVKCYFIFKGQNSTSETDKEQKIMKFSDQVRNNVEMKNANCYPILSWNIAYRVLDELGMKYVFTEYESKKDVVDLAIALQCPVISLGKDFYFYPLDYIPYNTIVFEESKVKCKIYRLQYFLEKHGIGKNDLAVFGTMLDQDIFPSWCINKRLPELKHVSYENIISTILSVLHSNGEIFRRNIMNNINKEETDKFLQAETILRQHLFYEGRQTFLVKYILSDELEFDGGPSWFAKGVCIGRIAGCYEYLVRNHILLGSWEVEDIKSEDSLVLSLKIIRYAYDLLTNYDSSTFTFIHRIGACSSTMEVTKELSINKPEMVTEDLYTSGWRDFTPLFDAFLKSESLDLIELGKTPSDVRILMVSLVYFSRRSSKGLHLTYSVLLCYLLLNLYSFNDTPNDMKKYFIASDKELRHKLDRETLHPVIQFQHCLEHMNNLNILCATKYSPSPYHKIINGTFIYNMMTELKNKSSPRSFLEDLLSPTPNLSKSFLNLISMYEKLN